MSSSVANSPLIGRSQSLNYSRPAMRGGRGTALARAAGPQVTRNYTESRSVKFGKVHTVREYTYTLPSDSEDEEENEEEWEREGASTKDDYDNDDDDENDNDQIDEGNEDGEAGDEGVEENGVVDGTTSHERDEYTLQSPSRNSIDSTYISTSPRLRATRHIVLLQCDRPQTASTTDAAQAPAIAPLKASQQRHDRRIHRESPRPLSLLSSTDHASSSRPLHRRPGSSLSISSTVTSEDAITPNSSPKHRRPSAATLKPIDFSTLRRGPESLSPPSSALLAPASSPSSSFPPSSGPRSHSSMDSASLASAYWSSPRTPAVVMYPDVAADYDNDDHNDAEGQNLGYGNNCVRVQDTVHDEPALIQRAPSSMSSRSISNGGPMRRTTYSSGGATVSEPGRGVNEDGEQTPPWQSSNHDISGLTAKQLKKLQKKGINPALYVEMQASRKRSGWIGALSGNTFAG